MEACFIPIISEDTYSSSVYPNTYNVPYVRRLLPGILTVVIHLTCHMQGLYVAKGNPKNILTWEDFGRTDITMVNREQGAGQEFF